MIILTQNVHAEDKQYIIDDSHFSLGFLVEHAGYAKTLGLFKHIDGSFIYNLIDPYRQTIANNNGKLYVQDDDFQQVIIYKNDNTFFLQDLFDNEYESENVPCSKICFKLLSGEDSSFQEALVSLDGDVIEWIRLLDIKDQRIFIKFENFKFESSNINYVIPKNYEIIKND